MAPSSHPFGLPPPGYIPGLGRGATGFSTRGDASGTAVVGGGDRATSIPSGRGRGHGRGRGLGLGRGESPGLVRDREWIQGGGEEEEEYEDGEAAEKEWEQVETYLSGRRKGKRRKVDTGFVSGPGDGRGRAAAERPRVVSLEAWEAMPESRALTKQDKSKGARWHPAGPERAAPDAILTRSSDAPLQEVIGGAREDKGGADTAEALVSRLGVEEDDGGGLVWSGVDVGRTRGLLKARCEAMDGTDGEVSWLAWIGFEEVHSSPETREGVLKVARRASAQCRGSGAVWLARARVEGRWRGVEGARQVLREATLGDGLSTFSGAVWWKLGELERSLGDAEGERACLRGMLERSPREGRAWVRLAELCEDREEARTVLETAVLDVCCGGTSEACWIKLAEVQDGFWGEKGGVERVLERAEKALGRWSVELGVARAREASRRGVEEGAISVWAERHGRGVVDGMTTEDGGRRWMEVARGEKDDKVKAAIVKAAVRGLGEDEDAWEEAVAAVDDAALRRLVLRRACVAVPGSERMWVARLGAERESGTVEGVWAVHEEALRVCKAAVVSLMAARHAWKAMGDIPRARQVLEEAWASVEEEDEEEVSLALARLRGEDGDAGGGWRLVQERLSLARQGGGTQAGQGEDDERVWYKAASLGRDLGVAVADVVGEGLKRHPASWKLWCVAVQSAEGIADARRLYADGLKACSSSGALWATAARAEVGLEGGGGVDRARRLLEEGRKRCPGDAGVRLASAWLEADSGRDDAARAIVAKAQAEVPQAGDGVDGCGRLWGEAVCLARPRERRGVSREALRRHPGSSKGDAPVICAVGRALGAEGHRAKARAWLERAVRLDPDDGDAWAALLSLVGPSSEEAADVEARCALADPRHGPHFWVPRAKAPGPGVPRSTRAVLRDAAASVPALLPLM